MSSPEKKKGRGRQWTDSEIKELLQVALDLKVSNKNNAFIFQYK